MSESTVAQARIPGDFRPFTSIRAGELRPNARVTAVTRNAGKRVAAA
jgi:hypothetical protein